MSHTARIIVVAISSLIYAPAMVLALIEIVGGENLQSLFFWATGQGCDGACRPVHFVALIATASPIAATLPALIWTGVIWIRRGRVSDGQVAEIIEFMRQPRDWTPTISNEVEPEVPRFYRDRQGKLRPMDPTLSKRSDAPRQP